MRDGCNKAMLRDAVRGIAPDSVVDQPPQDRLQRAGRIDFLDLARPAVQRELLADRPVFDLVRRDKIERCSSKRDLPNSESKFLFYFVNTKLFLERFATSGMSCQAHVAPEARRNAAGACMCCPTPGRT